jgi:hypothetical protein
MRKARNTLPVVVCALVILGMIAVAGHAQKVVPLASKPVPIVSVAGGIVGEGDPRAIPIQFLDRAFPYKPHTFVISNPDYPPSLNVYTNMTGPGTKTQMLSYYYCDGPHNSGDLICSVPEHDPYYYKRLRILGGIVEKRSNQVIFPKGNQWTIGCKKDLPSTDPCYSGVLTQDVIYDLTR